MKNGNVRKQETKLLIQERKNKQEALKAPDYGTKQQKFYQNIKNIKKKS